MRANQRGWMFRAVNGTHLVEQTVQRASEASPGASGGGPPSASRNAPGSPIATVGCESSDSQCSTIRSITRYPRRRISSGGNSSGPVTARS